MAYKSSTYRSPVDIVTYRYNGDLMYVPVGETYSQALGHARCAFPQLKKMSDASLTLSLNVITNKQRQLVGITPAAWPKITTHLARYEVIDVNVSPLANIPNITITAADDSEPAPPYQGRGDLVDGEKKSRSCPDLHVSCQAGPSSRPPSPARLSPKWLLSKFNAA